MIPTVRTSLVTLVPFFLAGLSFDIRAQTAAASGDSAARCAALVDIANLTIRSAVWKARHGGRACAMLRPRRKRARSSITCSSRRRTLGTAGF